MDLNYAKWDKVVEEVSQGCFCYLQIVLTTLGRHVSLPDRSPKADRESLLYKVPRIAISWVKKRA